jgi:hypothetical protein
LIWRRSTRGALPLSNFGFECNYHAIRLNPDQCAALRMLRRVRAPARAIRDKESTAIAHDRSDAVQHGAKKIDYTESVFATCRKQTRMSEKAKNTSEFVN